MLCGFDFLLARLSVKLIKSQAEICIFEDNNRPLEEPALQRFDKARLVELFEYKVTN